MTIKLDEYRPLGEFAKHCFQVLPEHESLSVSFDAMRGGSGEVLQTNVTVVDGEHPAKETE